MSSYPSAKVVELHMSDKIENIYESGKSKKPAYKIVISPKKIDYKKRADKIAEDLLSHNMRLYKDGKRMAIGSLNLTIMFPSPLIWEKRKGGKNVG